MTKPLRHLPRRIDITITRTRASPPRQTSETRQHLAQDCLAVFDPHLDSLGPRAIGRSSPFQDGVPHLRDPSPSTCALALGRQNHRKPWNAPLPAVPSRPPLSLPLSRHPRRPSHYRLPQPRSKTRPNPFGASFKRRETISASASVAPTAQALLHPKRVRHWNVESTHESLPRLTSARKSPRSAANGVWIPLLTFPCLPTSAIQNGSSISSVAAS